MKKFYYVILSMIAIALVSCTSGGVTNSNPSYFMPASRTVEKYGLELY
jgi:hypothetical protein